ncbi:arylsulfatase [Flammeovirga kamogawensis]|uniref:Arylsulfatase n=1 Tax=Flammeovirga kamogawensis TaxID=373891 RepID=A0ABX8H0N7_9BACT|nr:arylsulfatase [Flammeovirga kamogawensis]MBB6459328.1 arylsulfatase [Flammeovirga kamogawensis]QWG08887.1 arylsulfatase [Flammeovirga kamogawensis]TRX67177.1 arylsulfatase [Flammeovirga kamogawensis]
MSKKLSINILLAFLVSLIFCEDSLAQKKKKDKSSSKKPNILIIWGDDIGLWNISAYSNGQMGYTTPGIDRIADEGVLFTDYYGEQSCTAGRSSFITGQSGLRTGMTKVGMPGFPQGQADDDITIAEVLKNQGYITAQYGKNHLGDADATLPTKHGFDEFYGFLYHLNAMEEPEYPNYPKDPEFLKKFGPRGVLDCTSDGPVKDTGPLTVERIKTIDDDITKRSIAFMDKAIDQDKPFFVWWNAAKMHFRTHIKEESNGLSGRGFYNDGMVEHSNHVGQLLDYLDEKGIADNTIVIYGTDNGPQTNSWPDGAISPFRMEKETQYEGAYRVPFMIRWTDGGISGGKKIQGMISHLDWLPTLVAAAGDTDIKEKLLKGGYEANGKSFKIHLDGYNMLPYLQGKVEDSPRKWFIYHTSEAEPVAVRQDIEGKMQKMSLKWVFGEQRGKGGELWLEPFTWLRMPKAFDLKMDPFERADYDSNTYMDWYINQIPYMYSAMAHMKEYAMTFKEYPASQKPGSWKMSQLKEMSYEVGPVGPGGSKKTGE